VPHRVDARQLRTRARPRPLRRRHGWPCLRGEQGKEAHGGTRPRVLVGFDKGGGFQVLPALVRARSCGGLGPAGRVGKGKEEEVPRPRALLTRRGVGSLRWGVARR
jgi:hypothetical protein